MDHMYRKDKLTTQRDQLRELTGISSVANNTADTEIAELSPTAIRLQAIVDQIRDLDHKRYGYFRYILLAVGLVLSAIVYVVQGGHIVDMLMVVLLFIIYVWIAHRLMRSLRAQRGLEHGDHFLPRVINNDIDYDATIDRAKSVIDLSKRRLLLVTLSYVIFFPILLILLYVITIRVADLTPSYGIAWFIAVLLSVGAWYLYDNKDFDRRDDLLDALDRLVR